MVNVAIKPKSGSVAAGNGANAVDHKHGYNSNHVPMGLSARANRAYGIIHDGNHLSTHDGDDDDDGADDRSGVDTDTDVALTFAAWMVSDTVADVLLSLFVMDDDDNHLLALDRV